MSELASGEDNTSADELEDSDEADSVESSTVQDENKTDDLETDLHASDKERFSLEDLDTFAEQDIEADEELGDLLSRSYDSRNTDKDNWVLESSDGKFSHSLSPSHNE